MGVTAGCVGGSDVGDGGGVSSAQHMNSIEPFGKLNMKLVTIGRHLVLIFILIGFCSLDFTHWILLRMVFTNYLE